MKRSRFPLVCLLLCAVFGSAALQAQMPPSVAALQNRWAEVNYLTSGDSQLEAFSVLIEDARKATETETDSAEAWIWSGIIKSSYAGVKGGLGALSAAKAAKADLEKAIALNGEAMQGSAYTSLGVLYLNVPGWPVAFGDEEEGVALLKKGLELGPDTIDSNYFYAEYLFKNDQFDEARQYLQKALQAPARPGREIADQGRRQEIEKMLAQMR